MDKNQQLNSEIAKDYQTFPEVIYYIRSCHMGIGLGLVEMIERQEKKIEELKWQISHYPESIKRRKELIVRYPSQKAFHQKKLNNLLEYTPPINSLNQRVIILGLLKRISPEDFAIITRKTPQPSKSKSM